MILKGSSHDGPDMKDTSDPSENEFSLAEQFAGADSVPPLPRPPAKRPAAAEVPASLGNGAGLASAPRMPLRRPVDPENLLQLIDWSHLSHGIWQRSWIILLLVVACLMLGLFGRARTGKTRYESRASMLYRVERQKQALSFPGSGVAIKGLSRTTATSLLRRAGNLEQVISTLKLDMTPAEFGWRIQTQSERNSEIVLLRVDFMPTSDLAVAAANELVRVGLEDNRTFYRKQALQLAEQFERQSKAGAAEAATAGAALIAFQTHHQLLEVGADTKAFLDGMGAVCERLNTARIAHDSQVVRIANYRRLIAELPDEVMRESFEDNPLKRRIANAEVALMEARTRYGPENPRVLQIEDSVREMRRTMAEPAYNESREKVYGPNTAKREFETEVLRLETEQKVMAGTVAQIEQQAADLRESYKHLPALQIELAALHQRQAAAETLVRDLEKSIADARRAADVDLADFETLEPARTAIASRGKLASLLPALATGFGLFAGLALCVVLSLTDPKLKSPRLIERLYTLPCLGAVPALKDAAAVPAAFLPICRALYQRITSRPASGGARVFCVLSACPGDGKSTLGFQAARYWAALGIKTACLDFDPSPNPWLHPAENQAGIEDYLADRATWGDILFMRDDVACFKRNRDNGDLPEHMHGKIMHRFMETLRTQYGCVVIEAPAWMTEELSARMLGEMAGLSIWIAASPVSTRPILNKAFDSLDPAGIRPVGIILNRVPNADDLRQGGHAAS
jgi:capsular polysaccharide biosynthesis protein